MKTVWQAAKDKKVFVFSNGKREQVTERNRRALFRQLRKENFGLFPFHKTDSTKNVLVVSKFNQLTPTLSDLKDSKFLAQASAYFKSGESPVRVFNIGDEITPYLRSLNEIRTIQIASGQVSELEELLNSNTFPETGEDENTFANIGAGLQIFEAPEASGKTSGAPDHLKRLFAYNSVLRDLGKDYFNLKSLEGELIQRAEEAHVVTPVSSLIVLETQQDYDRFDIKKSKNSLQNASFDNSGSVPEPEEWLLILLVFSLVVYFYFKR